MLEIKDQLTYVFSKDTKPALAVDDGAIVKFWSRDCYNDQITTEEVVLEHLDTSSTDPATGPLFVNGAEEGDALKVTILDIEVADHGVVVNYPSSVTKLEGSVPKTRIFNIKDNKVDFNGISIDIEPMIGVIGTVPKERDVPTGHVFENGGNIDSRLNKKGAIIYLPVNVEGGLLSIGDCHAVMGDGEMVGTGLEVDAIVTTKVEVIKNANLNWPITEVNGYYFINVCGKTCDEAIAAGYTELHRLLVKNYGMEPSDAAMYISLQARLEASQAYLSPNGGGNSFRIGVPKLKDKKLF